MKYYLILILALLLLPVSIFAQTPNNKYGIHLAQPHLNDLKASAELVNSNGGKWGYVTLVIQENDRDKNKWQGIFDKLRELHLIPIIRLATQPEGENWRRPEPEDAKDWVEFLDSLNWVVKNRYVILFNEPNHASEWGGEVDEKSYAEVSFSIARALKEKNTDFFVMLAGFDASAPSWPPGMEDEEIFLERMLKQTNVILGNDDPDLVGRGAIPESKLESGLAPSSPTQSLARIKKSFFDYLDGWASHSYPNPDFSGSPWSSGRGSVRTYEWESGILRRLGVEKELPVFITETGWKHQISSYELGVRSYVDENTAGEYFRTAFEQVWNQDSRIWAVTPFVLDYQGAPFLEFSWKKFQSGDFYQQFYAVQSLVKDKGEPEQIEKGEIYFILPRELVAQSHYNFRINLKNQGQAVWDKEDDYNLSVAAVTNRLENYLISDLKDIKPFEEKEAEFSLKTDKEIEKEAIKFQLVKNDKVILESKLWSFKILPLPELNLDINFWPFGRGKGDDFELQLFDVDERLVFKKKGVKVENGQGKVKNIQNVALDELYRVVILKPGYLPRQTYIVFKAQVNYTKFKSLLPFDLNSDGKLDFKDFLKIFGS